jgi:predicted small lipoprotein YifL
MSGRARAAIFLGLALAALTACGLKGDPSPPEPDQAAPAGR